MVSVESSLKRAEAIDLSPVMSEVKRIHGYDDVMLVLAEKHYRRFLALNILYPRKTIVPNRLVDAVWHEHLLNSRKYMSDCQALFGEYLHHKPRVKLPEEFEETKQLYEAHFGPEHENEASIQSGSCAELALCGAPPRH